MLAFGERLALPLKVHALSKDGGVCLVYLRGDLGVGKTTLVKGIVKKLGYAGAVTSPTYTLVETYPIDRLNVFHFDLYRLRSAEELEFLGVRDMLSPPVLALIEWPENGVGVLPPADYVVEIETWKLG
nr:tRNA (adenosine(37)-N6)-threonylcarbamoyltransferase complex ATPase subunit type 1 TsaE [Acidiferrobacterales bacterium]